MPIYEYHCTKCKKDFELIKNTRESDNVLCPDCNELLEKQVSTGSFALKGSGWYKTDYASSSSKKTSTSSNTCSSGNCSI